MANCRRASRVTRIRLSKRITANSGLDHAQRLASVMHDGRLAGMVVMLTYAVHRIVCRGSHFVHADNGAVTNSAAIVPRHLRADGNGFKSLLGRCHVYTPALHDFN